MSTENKGMWIRLEESPELYALTGLPQRGDLIKIEYELPLLPYHGTAKFVKSKDKTAETQLFSKETGPSIIFGM